MNLILSVVLAAKRTRAMNVLQSDCGGVATAEAWMQACGGYQRLQDFRREVVMPLAASGKISTRGGVITLSDVGLADAAGHGQPLPQPAQGAA